MSKIITRALTQEQDGVPGFIASPERSAPGPALLIVHHHYGVTGHIKHMACEFAEAGYTTMVPALYDMLGFSDFHDVQKKTTDGRFVEVIGRGWQYLCGRDDVDEKRVAVMGLCMGGRIGIHFVAATPQTAAFLGYYPSVREEGPSELRPRHPNEAAREIHCSSMILFGGNDRVAPVPVQEKLRAAFLEGTADVEWHFFPPAGHGFALADGDAYDPALARLTWPLSVNFLDRVLGSEAVATRMRSVA